MINRQLQYTAEEYLKELVAMALPDFNIRFEAGYTFEDFLQVFSSKQDNIVYISYEGFTDTEEGYEDLYSAYIRCKRKQDLTAKVHTLRDLARRYRFFNLKISEEEMLNASVFVVAGNATQLTKGFDSYEVQFKII